MLNKSSLGMAQIASQSLVRNNVLLSVKPETPLELLTGLSTQQLVIDSNITIDGVRQRVEDLTASLESSANEPELGETVPNHTVQMDEFSDALTTALGLIHDLTQNKVLPATKRVVEQIENHLNLSISGTQSPLDLVVVGADPIFSSIYLHENVQRFARSLTQTNLINMRLPAPESIAQYIQTGHSTLDQELADFLDRVGDDFAISVWNDLFNGGATDSRSVYSAVGKENAAVLAFLFGAKMQTEVPNGLNIGLPQWLAYCAAIHSSAGAALAGYFNRLQNNMQFGRLVLEFPREQNPIGLVKVDKEHYEAFCAAGGCPELIFAEIYGSQRFDVQGMLSRADELRRSWQHIQASYQNSRAAQRHGFVIEALRSAVAAEIATEFGEAGNAEAHERLRNMARAQNPGSTQDLWKLARNTVCRVVFPDTAALTLLEAMDAQEALTPDLNPRELAFYGTIELVAQWLFSQIESTEYR